MVATEPARGPVLAAEHERPILVELDALLHDNVGSLKLVDEQGTQVELGETARRLLQRVVHGLAGDRPVAVVVLQKELTIHQAADLLDVPVPHLVQLLERSEIPFTQQGTRRRIRFEDLMAYKERRDAERRTGLAELTRLSQEMGLYDLDSHSGGLNVTARRASSLLSSR